MAHQHPGQERDHGVAAREAEDDLADGDETLRLQPAFLTIQLFVGLLYRGAVGEVSAPATQAM